MFTEVTSVEYTFIINETDPSAAITGVGTTVTFDGTTPVAAKIEAAAAAATCSRIAEMTEASLPAPGGRENFSVCVTFDETVSVNVTVALPSARLDGNEVIEAVRDARGADAAWLEMAVPPLIDIEPEAAELGEADTTPLASSDSVGSTVRDAERVFDAEGV